MPTTAKKTVTKTTVKKDASVDINKAEDFNESIETNVPAEETSAPVTKKVFTDSDYILCRSVWTGGLNVVSQSGNLYEFKNYGAECEINYRDLITMIRRGSQHIFLPRFVILDEDFLKDFPTVQKVYGTMYTMDDLVDILELPNTQMKREIETNDDF